MVLRHHFLLFFIHFFFVTFGDRGQSALFSGHDFLIHKEVPHRVRALSALGQPVSYTIFFDIHGRWIGA